MHLAVQQIDQRSVRFGPLVTYSPISRSVDYTFILFRHGRAEAAFNLRFPALHLAKLSGRSKVVRFKRNSRYGVCALESGPELPKQLGSEASCNSPLENLLTRPD